MGWRSDCLAWRRYKPGDSRPARVAGLSLLEVVCVVALIAVLASIGLGRFNGSLSHHGLSAAAQRVVADVELARQKATALGKSQTVTFVKSTAAYTLDGLADINRPELAYTVNLAAVPYECLLGNLDLDGTGGSVLTFNGYGRPILSDGASASISLLSITLQGGTAARMVLVDVQTGRAYVQNTPP